MPPGDPLSEDVNSSHDQDLEGASTPFGMLIRTAFDSYLPMTPSSNAAVTQVSLL